MGPLGPPGVPALFVSSFFNGASEDEKYLIDDNDDGMESNCSILWLQLHVVSMVLINDGDGDDERCDNVDNDDWCDCFDIVVVVVIIVPILLRMVELSMDDILIISVKYVPDNNLHK